jgi:hypothetical protein
MCTCALPEIRSRLQGHLISQNTHFLAELECEEKLHIQTDTFIATVKPCGKSVDDTAQG